MSVVNILGETACVTVYFKGCTISAKGYPQHLKLCKNAAKEVFFENSKRESTKTSIKTPTTWRFYIIDLYNVGGYYDRLRSRYNPSPQLLEIKL